MMQYIETVAVNAHTITSLGALQILHQFLRAVRLADKRQTRYLLFLSRGVELGEIPDNVEIVYLSGGFPGAKIYYCFCGIARYCKRHAITPTKVISLSNIGTWIGRNSPDYLYVHQSLMLYPKRWNPLRSSQRHFFFVRNIFRRFSMWSIRKNTTIIAQLDCTAEQISQQFKFPRERIAKITPEIILPSGDYIESQLPDFQNDTLKLFYPAAALEYKNHRVLFEALSKIKERRVKLYLTADEDSFDLSRYDFSDNISIEFLGTMSIGTVSEIYKRVDCLVFPSYIESFGLPMVEGALFGLAVLVSNSDFAHEVLASYSQAQFIDIHASGEWAKAICSLEIGKKNPAYKQHSYSSWQDFL